jgi:group I intron endonuclease
MKNFVYQLSKYDLSSFPAIFTGLAGVYVWTNDSNGKRYVGSTNNIRRRVGEYLNPNRLGAELARGESLIYKAMLKYGYTSFSFTILELVVFDEGATPEENAKILEMVEQQYLDELKPEYNLLRLAGSNAGFKMSPEARAKISAAKLGKPSHRKGKTMNESTREAMRVSSAKAKVVYVYDLDKKLVGQYRSLSDCAKATGISRHHIGKGLDSMYPVSGYYFCTNPIT